jgi:hypothetical protein
MKKLAQTETSRMEIQETQSISSSHPHAPLPFLHSAGQISTFDQNESSFKYRPAMPDITTQSRVSGVAWYRRRQAETMKVLTGRTPSIYLLKDGCQREVTEVLPVGARHDYADAVKLGEVARFVRVGDVC